MDTSHDYYSLLGVSPQASASVIKAAFKKQALLYHPDVYKGIDAEERMRGILQAYQTLSDPETRREYDARRQGEGGRVNAAAGPASVRKAKNGTGKPGQGRFAFPDLRDTPLSTLMISLENIPYRLSSAQAESLKWDGMLCGDASAADSSSLYHCQRCHHRWSAQGGSRPAACPHCRARDWSEYLLLRCIHCEAVFASRELRDSLRGNVLYYPYELFPLCPNCRRSQWCPSENQRVSRLRAAAARRTTLIWSSVAVICLLLVALLVLTMLR